MLTSAVLFYALQLVYRVHIYNLCVVVSKEGFFFHTVLLNSNNLQTDLFKA